MDIVADNMISIRFFPTQGGAYTFHRDIEKLLSRDVKVYQRFDEVLQCIEIQVFTNSDPDAVKKRILPYLLDSPHKFELDIFDSEFENAK